MNVIIKISQTLRIKKNVSKCIGCESSQIVLLMSGVEIKSKAFELSVSLDYPALAPALAPTGPPEELTFDTPGAG